MKQILILCCFFYFSASGQTQKSIEKDISTLKKCIEFLSDDKLEGRRTGTKGEQLASEYLITQFKKSGLKSVVAYPDFLQPFEIKDGKKIMASTLQVGDQTLQLQEDFFPMTWSGNGTFKNVKDIIWLDAALLLKENENNPHFDFPSALYDKIKNQKTSAVIIYNSGAAADNIVFEKKDKTPTVSFPVFYLKENARTQIKDLKNLLVSGNVQIENTSRTGHNVVGYIDNAATHTVVIGAHFDHLGFGEDGNSLYTGGTPMIHNGADDNASGTAALILLASRLKKSDLKNNNYLFVAFSGEELGLFGSKYFTEHLPIDASSINYMINMDMIGRLNDSTHALTVGGYGTSTAWRFLTDSSISFFKIKTDSSGSGPSDHTSFYRKNIPVLFFFTGTHHDYHKPTDDADKINYSGEIKIIDLIFNVISRTDKKGKIDFLKTREAAVGRSSFKVSLGIMPDYTFTGNGVLVDGVTEGRPAIKAGILQGDVIYKLGEYEVHDVQTYMQALNKFEKGQTTNAYIKRGDKEITFAITF